MATLKFYELENGKWENAKAEDSKSKIYFTHVLRSRWGIETQSNHAGNSFWVFLGAFWEGNTAIRLGQKPDSHACF